MSRNTWLLRSAFDRNMKKARETPLPVHPTALEQHRAVLANIDAYVERLRGEHEELREALAHAGIDVEKIIALWRERAKN